MILILSLTGCTGCNLRDVLTEPSEQPAGEEPISYQKISVDVGLKNSLNLTNGVTFNGATHTGEPYDKVNEAIKETKVDHASVAIFITRNDGVICGSGTIVDIDDGVNYGEKENNIFYVITCEHVIDSCELYAHEITISVPDANGNNCDDVGYDEKYSFKGKIGGAINQEQAVSLIGGDKKSDIALLRLYVEDEAVANNIVKAKIMSSEFSLERGESVFAIGNAEGDHAGWISAGVVADTNTIQEIAEIGDMALIGINVDIYQGNSGGGLFNLYGELVAINNSGETITDAYGDSASIGINFAIPHVASADSSKDTGFINVIRQLLGTYLTSGKNYGYIAGRADNYWFSFVRVENYLAVASVVEGSEAYNGVAVGDVIKAVSVNGTDYPLDSREALKAVINSLKIGDSITFNFTRVSEYGQNTNYTKTFAVKQYYFCNTGDYTNIKAS